MSEVKLPPTIRDQVIKALEDGCATFQEVGDKLGVSRQRVNQVIGTMGSKKRWAYDKLRENRAARDGITAFGETKTIGQWAEDWRCSVISQVIARRMRMGWGAEAAIATPTGGVRAKPQMMTPDERVRLVSLTTLARRVRLNMPQEHPARLAAHERDQLARALSNRGVTAGQMAEAVGLSQAAVRQWLAFTSPTGRRKRYVK